MELGRYDNRSFNRGAGRVKEALWVLTSWFLFRLCPFGFSPLKVFVLRCFGAKIGEGVIIKPQVKITFPWKLTVGDHVWLGEDCWLLNLEQIVIGHDVCISQRAFLCTGSHNYKSPRFDLIVKPITVEDGAWLGAGSWVGPGVTVGSRAVLTAGSVTGKTLASSCIYQGNPACVVRQRTMAEGVAVMAPPATVERQD